MVMVKSLKPASKDFEAEIERLKAVLEEQKRILQEIIADLRKTLLRNEFARRMRDLKKKREGWARNRELERDYEKQAYNVVE
jgi:hypothetical protein